MKKVMYKLEKLNGYGELSTDDQNKVIGGGHCYSKSCLRSRDKSMYSAASFVAGLGKGICQGSGWCD